MNIAGGSSSNGTNINISQSDDSNAQQFKLVKNIDGSYSIKTQASNFNGCIDVSGGNISLGSNIQQYSCNSTAAQKFNLIPISEEQPDKECDPDIDVCYIKTIQNNLYVGIKGNLDTNGSNVELTALGQEGKQEWKLIELPNGNYELRAYNSINNQTMNIAGGSSSNGTNINIYQSDDSNAQQFKLVQNIDGSYSIKTQASNFNGCIDVSGGNISLGSNIQQYSCNGTAAQKFNLIAVPIEEEEEEPQGTIEEIITNVYNERNELISTTKNEQTTTYQYNAEGKRISKSDGSDITKFIYEGTKIVLELDDLNNEIARNTYGLALVSREVNNEVGYYLYNGHGDTVVIINSDNEVLNTYEYDVWGVIISETESLNNPYKYAGYYYDTETGNYYLLSRYYNPEIARFISEDTYCGQLSDPLSLNRYVYVHNNPLIYYDPNGYFLIESLEWLGKRAAGLVHGIGELAVEAVVGIGTLTYNTGEFIGSSIGVAGNYYAYQLGITNKDTYNYLNDEYMKTFSRTGNTLINLLGNLVTGVMDNFKNTFNVDNFVNYLTTDNYNEIKNYSKSAVQTGLTIYGGYKLGKSVYNKITSPSSFGAMSKTDAARYNQYWDDVKQGLTAEHRFNIQKFGDINGSIKNTLPFNGYTKHGINSAISHDGVGISQQGILDTIKNPTKTVPQSGGRLKYVGKNGTVILNKFGKVVTAWAKNSDYWRGAK